MAIKKLVLLLTITLLASTAFAAENTVADTLENRTAEAARYLSAMPPKAMLKDMTQKLAVQFPEEKRKFFVDLMTRHLDLDKMTTVINDALVKHFTAEELKALADFYGSKVGRSAMAKFGDYMAETMPHVQSMMIEAFQKAAKEMNPHDG